MSTPRKTAAKPGSGAGTQSARTTGPKPGTAAAAGKPAGKSGKKAVPPPPGPGLVVGTVPPLARVAGGVALLAAVLLLVAPAFPLATAGGAELGGPGNAWAFVPPLPLVAVVAAGGVLAVRARLPRLGLAVLFPAGTVAAGLLLQQAELLRTGSHSTLDLPFGIGTSSRYEVGPGLVVSVLGYALLVAAALLAAAAWPRTIMEDGGDLDPRRPRLAAWGLAVGVLTALVLGMAPYSSTIGPGAPTLPERHGLDLLGAGLVALGPPPGRSRGHAATPAGHRRRVRRAGRDAADARPGQRPAGGPLAVARPQRGRRRHPDRGAGHGRPRARRRPGGPAAPAARARRHGLTRRARRPRVAGRGARRRKA